MMKKTIRLALVALVVLTTGKLIPVSAMEAPVHYYPVCMSCINQPEGSQEGRLYCLHRPIGWSQTGFQRICQDGYKWNIDIEEKRVLKGKKATYYWCNNCHHINHVSGECDTRWECFGTGGNVNETWGGDPSLRSPENKVQ